MSAPSVEAPGADVVTRPRLGTSYWVPAASLIAFLLLWQLLIIVFQPNEILFPGPVAVVGELIEVARNGLLWRALADSMVALAIGLGLALIVGPVVGLLVGMSRIADLLAGPYLWAGFATPDIAIAPLVIIWLGFGIEAKVWMVFFAALIPLMLSCKEGVQSVDASLLGAARSFGASRSRIFRSVMVPSTLPFIASGVRNAVSRGFVGLLVVEVTVGSGGLGTEVMRATRQFNAARTFAFILVLVVIAMVLITLSKRLEAHASRWREEVAL
jgi:ABC-type nitrate/sulfonate/bicarbonate transport system permease component